MTHAPLLLTGAPPGLVDGDKGCDQQELVGAIEARGGEAVIPSRKNRTVPRASPRTGTRIATWSRGSGPRPSRTGAAPPATRRPPATSAHAFAWHPS
ncbi:hypothetical protein [Gemmata massiliana]|uniref:hypothetical protein n=1 Tax=Gemmata massiliana TaxID=1210884 RepID=UPI0036F3CDFE